ncbi:MAG: hypothetical protein WC490_05095 [Candidatus Margulisiibacteriota bacterium]
MANLICSQWKQIIDGTKTDGIISLSALTIDDLKSLGILDASISSYTKATEAIAKFNYVKANHDRNTFSVDLKTLPNIALSDTANHYIYELITLGPIDAVLSSPRTTQDQVNEVIASLEAIVRESSGDREFLAVPAKLMLAEAYSRSEATRSKALDIYNELIGALTDPKQLLKAKLGLANALVSYNRELDKAKGLFMEVLSDQRGDKFSKEMAAVGLANLMQNGKTEEGRAFARSVFEALLDPDNKKRVVDMPAGLEGVKDALTSLGRTDNAYVKAWATVSLANYFIMAGDMKSASDYSKIALELPAVAPHLKAQAFSNLGIIRIGDSDFRIAHQYFETAARLQPNDPALHIYKARAMFLTERFSADRFMESYQTAIKLIWQRVDPEEKSFDLEQLLSCAMAGKDNELFGRLSATGQGRFLLLTALEAKAKVVFAGGDTVLAAQYLEKARDLFDGWKKDSLEVGADYLFEQQLHYDLATFYTAWPINPRFEDARKEYELLKELGAPSWWVKDQLAFLHHTVLGLNASSGSLSAYLRKYFENGQLTVNFDKNGGAADAFFFTDEEKTRGITLHLGIYSGGAWSAAAGLSQARGPVTLSAGLHASSDGNGDKVLGFDVEASKRFDRFFKAGLRGRFDQHIGEYKYSEWELTAFAYYARSIDKGTTFFARLEIGVGQKAQTAWKTFFEAAKQKRVPGWQWKSETVSFTRISSHPNDLSGQHYCDKIYWRTQPLYDQNHDEISLWHVDTMLRTSLKPIELVTIDPDDSSAEPAEIQLMRIEKRSVGLPASGPFWDPNVSTVYPYISTPRTGRPDDSVIDAIPFDSLLRTEIGPDGNALPTIPVTVYEERISNTEYSRSNGTLTTTITIQGKTETEDWRDSYQLIYEKTSESLVIWKKDLVTGEREQVYSGASVRDGSIAVQNYLNARLSVGVEKRLPGGMVGIEGFGQITKFWGGSDPNGNPSHVLDPDSYDYGVRLYGTKIMDDHSLLTGEVGWSRSNGINWRLGAQVLVGGKAGRADINVPRFELGLSSPGGVYADFGTYKYRVGYNGRGYGASLCLGEELALSLTNRGFGLSGPAGLAFGSGGFSWSPVVAGIQCLTSYFFEIKPLRDNRHELEAKLKDEQDLLKRALLNHHLDLARIKEESSRANIGGDLTLLRFLGNNSDKAFGVINAEISKAISSMKEKLDKKENAQEEITYLLLTLSSPGMGRHINKAQIALELSAIIKAGGDNAKFITDLWAAFPAELKPKEDDQAALTIFEGKDKYAVSVRTKDLVEAVLGGKYEEFQKDLLLGEKALDQIKKVRDLLRRDDLRSSFDRSSAMSKQSRSKHDFDTMVYDLTKATRKLIEENADGSNNDQIYVNSLVLLSLANQVGRQTIIPILSRVISDVPEEIQKRLEARFEGFYQSRALAVLDLKDTGIDFTVSERTGEKDSNQRYIRIERTTHYSMTEFVHRSISRTIREETADGGSTERQ